jgi:2-succinyl-6-hydroxy-2,4-cyclohexadiene-1-carboxylate synthase
MDSHSIFILVFHGFLGGPDDWMIFDSRVKASTKNCTLWAPNLWEQKHWLQEEIGPKLSQKILSDLNSRPDFVAAKKRILVGYSLGGRIAANLATAAIEPWDQVHLVSTGLGITSSSRGELIQQRLIDDALWTTKLNSDSADDFLDSWNRQTIFADVDQIERQKQKITLEKFRLELSLALNHWSLGRQNDLWSFWANANIDQKLFFYLGSDDSKYRNMYKENLPSLNHRIILIPHRRHRIINEASKLIAEGIL